MTVAQLQNFGIAVDKWDTLEGVCTSMLFSNEGYISPSQKTCQIYIDSKNALLFIRHTRGDLHNELKNGMVSVNILEKGEVKQYYTTLCSGGINDANIGTYHECFDISEITSIR